MYVPRVVSLLPARLALSTLIACAASPLAAQSRSYTSQMTSSDTEYTPGTQNAFHFEVSLTTNGTAEFIDNFQFDFVFPAGMVVNGVFAPSPFTTCGGGQGNLSIPSPSVALVSTPGHPSGCGAFSSGTYEVTVNATAPADYRGPIGVIAKIEGDGWPPPLDDPQVSTYNFPFEPHLDLFKNGFEGGNACLWSAIAGGPPCS